MAGEELETLGQREGVIFALGIGLRVQAYLDPAALPANLYDPVLEHLLS